MKMLPPLLAMLTLAGVSVTHAQLNTRLTAQRLLGSETSDLWTQGNYVYVARGDQGMTIVDVTNPANPVLRGTFAPTGCHTHSVQVIGNLAYLSNYVANNSGTPIVGLYIADVSNPNAPVEVGRLEWGQGAWYHLGGSSSSVTVEARGLQRIAYVCSDIDSEVEIFDVTVPNAAVYIGPLGNPVWTYYSQPHEVRIYGTRAVTTWLSGGFTIDDVTNPAAPVRLVHQPGGNVWTYDAEMNAAGTHLVTTHDPSSGNSSVKIWSLAGLPSSIAQVGTYTCPNATLLHNIAVQGQYAYISNFYDGLRILDISNPAAPFLAGHYDTDPASASSGTTAAYGVQVSGNNIFLTHSTKGLYVLDFVDTITITKAEWSNQNDTLTVEATSTGSPHLTLNLAGYGPMTWNSTAGRYRRVQTGVHNYISNVTVTSSISGTDSESVRRVR